MTCLHWRPFIATWTSCQTSFDSSGDAAMVVL